MAYTHLHVHSNYSYGMGASSIESLIRRAKELQYDALAITDRNTMAGVVEFYSLCREAGLFAVIGSEVDDPRDEAVKTVLLCRDFIGYQRLCSIITARQLDAGFNLIASLKQSSKGLFILTYSLEILQNVAGDNVFGEIVLLPENRKRNRAVYELCQRRGIEPVLTNEVYMAVPEDYAIHRVLSAMKNLSTVFDDPERISREQYLKSPEAMMKAGAKFPAMIASTERVVRSCQLEFALKKFHCARYIAPDGTKPAGHELLRKLAYDGLKMRYGISYRKNIVSEELIGSQHNQLFWPPHMDQIVQRLETELEVITNLSFCDYFLICRDIVNYAHSCGFWHVGRGSAANSIVSYCLGITEVDPIKYNLYFERFLNYARGTPPDIDLDFSWRHRDEMLEYIYQRYGSEHVAMTASIHTLRARGALREVAKAYGISERELNTFRKFIPHTSAGNLLVLKEQYPEMRDVALNGALFQNVLRIASALDGFPDYSGIHSSGVVITEKPITMYSALERKANGFIKTQLDMYSGEDMGLIKVDILAVRGLGTIEDAVRNIGKATGESPEIFNWNKIFDDPEAQKLMASGNTIGVVHAESPFIRNAMHTTQANTFELLHIVLGMVRTGCVESGMIHTFIERLLDPEKRKEAFPALVDILPETFGVMIFEEDVIRVLHFVGGLSLEEADVVRRYMGGKRVPPETIKRLKEKFTKGTMKKLVDIKAVALLWTQIESFSGFSFCKAHSASYALMAFQAIYLKIHHPAHYMAAVLSNEGGFYTPASYISECRRLGLRILPPDINRSEREYAAEGDKAIRIGLRFIANLTSVSLDSLFKAREERSFDSLHDFVLRVNMNYEETINLIRVGCFDFTGKKRTLLIALLDVLTQIKKQAMTQDLFKIDLRQFERSLGHIDDLTFDERLAAERDLLGYFIHQHPLEFFPKQINHKTITKAKDLSKHKGKKVKMIGWLVSAKRIRTRDKKNEDGEVIRQGEYMKFMTMEDITGVFDTVLFPKVYKEIAAETLSLGPYCLEGMVDARYNTINVTRMELLKTEAADLGFDAKTLTEKQPVFVKSKTLEDVGNIEGILPMPYEVGNSRMIKAS